MICAIRRNKEIPERVAEIFAEMALKGKRGPHEDGTGALFCLENKPIVFKSLMKAWEAKTILKEIIRETDPSLCILHARKASKELKEISKRAVTISLVHPHSRGSWYVFHNGTLRSVVKEVRPGEFSDTAGAAELLEREGIEGLLDLLRKEKNGSNFFIYNEEEGKVYVIHSSPVEREESLREYYELYAGNCGFAIISSERNEYAKKRAIEVLEVEFEDPLERIWIWSQKL